MRFVDYFRSVRHTFAANRIRAALTLLGIVIGAGSIVLLADLLRGGEEALVRTSQQANEADLVKVHSDAPPAKQSQRTRRELSQRDADSLSNSPLLGDTPIVTEVIKDHQASFVGKTKRVGLLAGQPEMLGLYRLEVEHGRFLNPDDVQLGARVCVVGQEVWTELLNSRPDLDTLALTIDGHEWSVVGVLKHKPRMGGGNGTWMWDRRVLVPHRTFDTLYAPAHAVDNIYVRLRGSGPLAEQLRAIEQVIGGTLLREHLGVQNFKVASENSDGKQEKLILGIIKMLLLGTGMLSLFVGGINIMNIMLVTVTERTREIGIRRALGAPPSSILLQFLIEAVLIALTGGVIGVGGGIFLSFVAAKGLSHSLGEWKLHVEGWAILLGLSLSLFTGVVFGLFPAWRAAKLDPVEALRYE